MDTALHLCPGLLGPLKGGRESLMTERKREVWWNIHRRNKRPGLHYKRCASCEFDREVGQEVGNMRILEIFLCSRNTTYKILVSSATVILPPETLVLPTSDVLKNFLRISWIIRYFADLYDSIQFLSLRLEILEVIGEDTSYSD